MRLPRAAYWVLGGAIALVGALVARGAAEAYPDHRILLWLTGGGVIFIGLAVLSLGTRSRLEIDPEEDDQGSADDAPRGGK